MKTTLLGALALTALTAPAFADRIEMGPRPGFLIDRMPASELKTKLAACADAEPIRSDFSIGHRGAAMMFPEHTEQSYRAAARMGAGILECDVTFTKDKQLVCRHAQNDLHTTTNILATDLASTCAKPFSVTDGVASAECRTSELTLAEFQSLTGKMDAADKTATTVEGYLNGTPRWRTDLYATEGKVMTHAESIALFKELGVKFTPELKSPSVEMPFDGFTQQDYAQKMIDEYKAAGVSPSDVFAQSFNLDDILYWIKAEPEFGKQAVYLVELSDGFNPQDANTWKEDFAALKAQGVNYLAPSMNMLLTVKDGQIVASDYAKAAKEAGLNLITWTLERSGPLAAGGGWYFQTIKDATTDDSVYFTALDVLAQDVGVKGVFSDWPATTTYYASCMAQKAN